MTCLRHSVPLMALALTLAGCSPTKTTTSPPGGERASVPTVAFLYQSVQGADSLKPLGRVDMIVITRQGKEERATRAIHAHGAQAFRYVQSFWFPAGKDYDGLDIGEHRDMAFCLNGSAPAVGRESAGNPWWFIDANEQAVHDWFTKLLERLKRAGYDGIMFDRGLAALTGGDPASRPVWNKQSSCTEKPVNEGATMADAYVSLMKLVSESGLKLFQNYGHSPLNPAVRFRPDPADPDCGVSVANPKCSRTDDGLRYADYFLDEAVAHPKDKLWELDFDINRSNEQDKRLGGRVVGLITQGTLEGSASSQDVVFQYARVRLFDMPVAIFTGYDNCKGVSDFCNRLGAYPRLASARWGEPVTAAPRATECAEDSKIHCLWTRQYERGVVVVNASNREVVTKLRLGRKLCGSLIDLGTGVRHGSGCRSSLPLRIPAWSGQPLHLAK